MNKKFKKIVLIFNLFIFLIISLLLSNRFFLIKNLKAQTIPLIINTPIPTSPNLGSTNPVPFSQTVDFPLPTFTPMPTAIPTPTIYDPYKLTEFLKFDSGCGDLNKSCCFKFSNNLTDGLIIALFRNHLAPFLATYSLVNFLSIFSALDTVIFIIDRVFSVVNSILFFGLSQLFPFLNDIYEINVNGFCKIGFPSHPNDMSKCVCMNEKDQSTFKMCNLLSREDEIERCFNDCMKDGKGVWTAFGCFSSDFSSLIRERVFKFGIGLAGFFSIICIIYASFLIQTSSGSPDKIKKAQEILTSCITGLILIIFSVFILRLIGYDILGIKF